MRRLVVVTPHVQQIQDEFGRAFERWHAHHYPDEPPVEVDFRHPGGTSEIIKQLSAEFSAAIKAGRIDPETAHADPGTISFDIMFGGGTYDHGRLASGVSVTLDGARVRVPMSVPAGFEQQRLAEWFGLDDAGRVRRLIGASELFHEQQYWIGTALSGFGIVYNRELLDEMGLDEPASVEDMIDPGLAGWVALCDPRQSGSMTTSFDAVLNNYGWARGWHILRALSANTRYFTDRSTKPPIDVAQGEAALGLAIDFYGRSQSQAVMRSGQTPQTSRVGYVDPPGKVFIDPDPISILRGGPNPELARRFVVFVNSALGQSLWQFPATSGPRGGSNPIWHDGMPMGPERVELRRMPITREMYQGYSEYFVDRIDPYGAASSVGNRGWRSGITPMMASFGVDSRAELKAAWQEIARLHRANPDGAHALSEAIRRFDLLADRVWADARDEDRQSWDASDAMDHRFYERGVVSGYEWADAESLPGSWPAELVRAHEAVAEASRLVPRIFECERVFYRLPTGDRVGELWDDLFAGARDADGEPLHPEGAFVDFTPSGYRAIRETWRDERVAARLSIVYTKIAKENYREVVALAQAEPLGSRSSGP